MAHLGCIIPFTKTAKSSSWYPLMLVPCPALPTTEIRLTVNGKCSYDKQTKKTTVLVGFCLKDDSSLSKFCKVYTCRSPVLAIRTCELSYHHEGFQFLGNFLLFFKLFLLWLSFLHKIFNAVNFLAINLSGNRKK